MRGVIATFLALVMAASAIAQPASSETGTVLVPKGTVVRLRFEQDLDSRNAKPGDAISFRVQRDVRLHGRVAIPAGTKVTADVLEVTGPEPCRNAVLKTGNFRFDLAGSEQVMSSYALVYQQEHHSALGKAAGKVGTAVAMILVVPMALTVIPYVLVTALAMSIEDSKASKPCTKMGAQFTRRANEQFEIMTDRDITQMSKP